MVDPFLPLPLIRVVDVNDNVPNFSNANQLLAQWGTQLNLLEQAFYNLEDPNKPKIESKEKKKETLKHASKRESMAQVVDKSTNAIEIYITSVKIKLENSIKIEN